MSSITSTCTAHPGFEAIGRCKQCGKPFCSQCQTKGPTGIFCCGECKELHEEFTARAQQLDSMKRESTFFEKIKIYAKKLIVFAILGLLVAGGLHFAGIEIPVLSEFIDSLTGS